MSSQGPLSCGTATTPGLTAVGSYTNPDNIKVSDNVYAVGQLDFQSGFNATNFGFSIPTGSTINGILFEVEKKNTYSGTPTSDFSVKIIKSNGTAGSVDKKIVGNWSDSDTYSSYGGASDLWSETWTAEDINDADFGLAFGSYTYDGSGSVDHVRCTVYYTAGGGSANTGFFGLM